MFYKYFMIISLILMAVVSVTTEVNAFTLEGQENSVILIDRNNPLKASFDSFFARLLANDINKQTEIVTFNDTLLIVPMTKDKEDIGYFVYVDLSNRNANEAAYAEVTLMPYSDPSDPLRHIKNVTIYDSNRNTMPLLTWKPFICGTEKNADKDNVTCLEITASNINEMTTNLLKIQIGKGPFAPCAGSGIILNAGIDSSYWVCGRHIKSTDLLGK
ncbi:MAG: hypothetical protein HYS21_13205 [Deltaproteobacteria bacterium]|nr:hypothetical protein [Deltaproteobacteria bacterium]